MSSRRHVIPAAVAALVLGVAGAGGADAAVCPKATLVTVVPHGETAVVVTWRAPRHARALKRRIGYRVVRAGHVVGQTWGHSMLVRVHPSQWVTIKVGVVGAHGRRPRCAVAVRAFAELVERAPLDAPQGFQVGKLSPSRLRLRWGGVDGASAYRVYRDGLVVKQVAQTQLDVRVVAGQSYQFQVAAVDTQGRAGAMSRVLSSTTDTVPPSAPTGLDATLVSPGTYRVSWTASEEGTSPIRGYRVLRDGVVMSQVPDTSYTVSGLQAGSSYRIEVRAVDARGNASAASAPLQVTLDPPPATHGGTEAFLLASTDRSFTDFQANYMQIGRVYPTYFDCNAAGSLLGVDDPRITRWAQLRRVEVYPRINCQNTQTLHTILTDPVVRGRWLDQILSITRSGGYEGINLDFEAGLWTDRAAFSSFVNDLATRLHAEGRGLTVDVSAKANDSNPQHPRSGIFDYPVLAQSADEVLLMSWGWHWLTSSPGQVSPLSWLAGVAQYAASMPNPDRFRMGSSMYGIDWVNGGGPTHPNVPLEYTSVVALAASVGQTPQRDPGSGELYFAYDDASGNHHDVRFHDVTTVATKQGTQAASGIPRTFVWRLGEEDPRIWTLPSMGGSGS